MGGNAGLIGGNGDGMGVGGMAGGTVGGAGGVGSMNEIGGERRGLEYDRDHKGRHIQRQRQDYAMGHINDFFGVVPRDGSEGQASGGLSSHTRDGKLGWLKSLASVLTTLLLCYVLRRCGDIELHEGVRGVVAVASVQAL